MIYGINLNPVLPLRREPAEQSEMLTQLLFGEHFTVLEETEKWLKIQNSADAYEGWIDRKMMTGLDSGQFDRLESAQSAFLVKNIFLECADANGETMILPAGGKLFFFDKKGRRFGFLGDTIKIFLEKLPSEEKTIAETAQMFLNAPYLWGGKTIFGIDCSGLVQLVFSLFDISLPRDAYQQAECGEAVNSLQETQENDLAFFANENGKITHVGILLDNERIIHASGKVRIDKIDEKGIFLNEKYTHKLHSIRRL
jgi:hypothetical protein